MGGRTSYGFSTEPLVMNGINTKRLVANPDEMGHVRLMYEMYAQPKTSYGDIVRYFAGQGILFYGLSYVNAKIEELDGQRQTLNKKIADLSVQTISPEQIDRISDHLDDWENVSFEDKRQVLNSLVSQIRATSEELEIIWKF